MQSVIFILLICISLRTAYAGAAPKWIAIPAGSYEPLFTPSTADPKGLFNLLQNEKEKRSPVVINIMAFEIQSEPVTNEEFATFVQKYPEWRKDSFKRIFADKRY